MRLLISIVFISLLAPTIGFAVTLKDAIVSAEQRDPTLNVASANRIAANAGIDVARARLLPSITAQGTFTQTDFNTERPNSPIPLSTQTKTKSTNSQVLLRQALFRMKDRVGLKVSELQLDFSSYKLAASYSELWLRVSNAWYDVLAAQAVFKVQQEALQSIELVAKQAQRSYEAGQGTKDAAIEAKAQLALVRSNLTEALGQLDARQRAFEKLTGIPYSSLSKQELPHVKQLKPLPMPRHVYIEKSLNDSPDVMAARVAELIRQNQLKQAGADHYPTLDFVSSYTRTQNDNVNQIGLLVNSTAVGVQLVVPIFSGGGVNAQERQAAANVLASESERKALELKLQADIDGLWSSQEALLARVIASLDLVEAAQETAKANRLGIRAGLKSWSDVGNSELILARRRAELFNNIATFKKTQARLLAYIPVSDEQWDLWLLSDK